MPIPQSAAVLKSYFQNGLKPDQAQFAELIDTFYFLYQDLLDQANEAIEAAEEAAAEALALAPALKILVRIGANGVPTVANGNTYVTAVGLIGPGSVDPIIYQINFATPFANTDYIAMVPSGTTIIEKQVGNLKVQTPNGNGKTFYLVMYK